MKALWVRMIQQNSIEGVILLLRGEITTDSPSSISPSIFETIFHPFLPSLAPPPAPQRLVLLTFSSTFHSSPIIIVHTQTSRAHRIAFIPEKSINPKDLALHDDYEAYQPTSPQDNLCNYTASLTPKTPCSAFFKHLLNKYIRSYRKFSKYV